MEELTPSWNQKLLKSPPVCNIKTEINHDNIDKLKTLKQVLEKGIGVLKDDIVFSSEIATLMQLVYKRNLQLRGDKTMQFIKQIVKCLKRFITLDIKQEFSNFKKDIDELEIRRGVTVYLPSRQMYQYIIVKIISLAMLMSQTQNYCLNAFLWCKMRLEHGHMVPQYLLYISNISRICAICKSLYYDCINWYKRLFPLQVIFQPTHVEWLSEKDALPTDLDVFVKRNIKLDFENDSEFTKAKTMIQKYFDETTTEMKQIDKDIPNDTNIQHKEPVLEDDTNITVKNDGRMSDQFEEDDQVNINEIEDIGDFVSRDILKEAVPNGDNNKSDTKSRTNLSTANCRSFKDLINLVKSSAKSLPKQRKICLDALKINKQRYRNERKEGYGSEIFHILFPKSVKKVNRLLQKCQKKEMKKAGMLKTGPSEAKKIKTMPQQHNCRDSDIEMKEARKLDTGPSEAKKIKTMPQPHSDTIEMKEAGTLETVPSETIKITIIPQRHKNNCNNSDTIEVVMNSSCNKYVDFKPDKSEIETNRFPYSEIKLPAESDEEAGVSTSNDINDNITAKINEDGEIKVAPVVLEEEMFNGANVIKSDQCLAADCQSFQDLIMLVKSSAKSLPKRKKICLAVLKVNKQKYRTAQKEGNESEIFNKLFPKSVKKVNILLRKCQLKNAKNLSETGKSKKAPQVNSIESTFQNKTSDSASGSGKTKKSEICWPVPSTSSKIDKDSFACNKIDRVKSRIDRVNSVKNRKRRNEYTTQSIFDIY